MSKRTNGQEDKRFNDFLNGFLSFGIDDRDKTVFCTIPDASGILEYVMENFSVDEVFDESILEEWTRDNGYIKAEG